MSNRSAPMRELRDRVQRWASILRVSPRIVRIQKMKRKWGSCSSGGILTFPDDLSEQSEDFQDFVIIHELLHLRIPTHGRLFKALMSAHAPGWQRLEKERLSRRVISSPVT